jgi:hypothetical protein
MERTRLLLRFCWAVMLFDSYQHLGKMRVVRNSSSLVFCEGWRFANKSAQPTTKLGVCCYVATVSLVISSEAGKPLPLRLASEPLLGFPGEVSGMMLVIPCNILSALLLRPVRTPLSLDMLLQELSTGMFNMVSASYEWISLRPFGSGRAIEKYCE